MASPPPHVVIGSGVLDYSTALAAIRSARIVCVKLDSLELSLALARDFITLAPASTHLTIYTDCSLLRDMVHAGICIARHASIGAGEADQVRDGMGVHWPRVTSEWVATDSSWTTSAGARVSVVLGAPEWEEDGGGDARV